MNNKINLSIVQTIEQLCSKETINTSQDIIHKICIKNILRLTTLKGLTTLQRIAISYPNAHAYLIKYTEKRKKEVKI